MYPTQFARSWGSQDTSLGSEHECTGIYCHLSWQKVPGINELTDGDANSLLSVVRGLLFTAAGLHGRVTWVHPALARLAVHPTAGTDQCVLHIYSSYEMRLDPSGFNESLSLKVSKINRLVGTSRDGRRRSPILPPFWVEGYREAKSSVFLCRELLFPANTWKSASRSSCVEPCGCSGPSSHGKCAARPVCRYRELCSFLFFLEGVIYWFEGSGCRGDLWKQWDCQVWLFGVYAHHFKGCYVWSWSLAGWGDGRRV